ncbi:hypothetical protein GCM10010492_34160 [Saccharothrix mutabilis subsp. mutabilis]|uniref:Uncharacterized protein n=1 Tax=Saccharothrix mutabilis subsp. mutabilis TaxID=66855 RepID=A0ABN0TXB5_9PSEU
MTHPPTTLLVPRSARAERRLWVLLALLFILVAGVNGIVALSEAQVWQGGLAGLSILAAAGCARVAHRVPGAV